MATERALEKRRRMLDAARVVMLRDGMRGATMEAIAREAGVAKPTLYAQFSDKDSVFVALLSSLLDQLGEAFTEGLAGPGGVAERIGEGLARQYLLLADILEGSPHAPELMSQHKRIGLSLKDKDLEMLGRIETELARAGVAEPGGLAHLVVSAAYGIALKTSNRAEMAGNIRLACRRLIDPALTQKSSGRS